MSLHAIEIAAVVTVAILLRRFCGLLCRNVEPLAADAAVLKVNVKLSLQLLFVLALNPRKNVQRFRIACL